MSGQRKLQQEMDRVFKKIGEGLEIFDVIYDRHQNASNSSQKDKLENDLKKEIKKLQRFREQVKNWQTGTEIKDKSQLLEHRKLVEVAMEKYKEVEKGSKLKAYSDISLAAVDKPAIENEAIDFVNQALDLLHQQTESMEAEMDRLTGNGKKSKKRDFVSEERKRELVELLSTHQWHIEKLELIQKLLQNEILPIDDVLEISDDINYYIEENQNPDFIYDDSIYDDLDLDFSIDEEDIDINDINEENIPSANSTVVVSTPPTTVESPSKLDSNKTLKKKTHELLEKRSDSRSNSIPTLSSLTPSNDKQVHQISSSANNSATVTTLKPAPAPLSSTTMNWSAAISANKDSPRDSPKSSSNSTTATTTPTVQNNVIQVPQPSNVNALNAASVLEALKKQKPRDENASVPPSHSGTPLPQMKTSTPLEQQTITKSPIEQQQILQSQIEQRPSQSLTEQQQCTSQHQHQVSTSTIERNLGASIGLSKEQIDASSDSDFRFLPTGIQSLILSMVGSNSSSIHAYNSVESVNFTNSGTYPPGNQAMQLNQIWDKVSHCNDIKSIINGLGFSELFYGYYYGISNEERQLCNSSLKNLGWLRQVDGNQWLLPKSISTKNEIYSIGDFEIFDVTKWSICEKKGLKIDNVQLV